MSLCEICCNNEAKYRCPGCSIRTCRYVLACGISGVTCVLLYSVRCVKAHKVENDCDGRRCKTAYVSQSEFTDAHLLSG